MRAKHTVIYIIFGTLWLHPLWALANPAAKVPEEPSTLLDEDILVVEEYIEDTRQTVSTRVLRLADSIDTLFGDKKADDQKNQSTLRISQRYFHKDGVTGGEDVAVTLNLHLPNLQKLEEKIKNKFKSKPAEGTGGNGGPAEPESPWTFNQESGVVIANPINYFARLRLRRDFLTEKWVHSFYEQVGWSKTNEWEEETSFNSDYALTRSLLFRFANLKSWAMTDDILKSSHGPSLLQQLSEHEAISYDLRLNTLVEDHALYGDSVTLGSLYRTRLPVGWIFLDLNPEIAWERKTNFRVQYNFYLRVELVFGNIKK
jgi:hypothetical protein